MTLSKAQLRVLKSLANGARVVQLDGSYRLKAVNGKEKRLRFATVRALWQANAIDKMHHKITPAGRKAVTG